MDPVEALRAAKAAKAEATAMKAELDATRIQLESARQALAMERRKAPQVVEKLPDDYVEMKKRLAAAEKEADRLADELDRAKMTGAKEAGSRPSERILAAIGCFMTEAGGYPEMLRRNNGLMSADDWALVLARVRVVRDWAAYMEGAYTHA